VLPKKCNSYNIICGWSSRSTI